MLDGKQRETTILLLIITVLVILVVFELRFIVISGHSPGANVFRPLTAIMLGLIAVCADQSIQLL